MAEVVTIKVHSGRNIGKKDGVDPFCVIWTLNKKKKKKTAASKTGTPVWNETIYLPLNMIDSNTCASVECWDKKFLKPGEFTVALRDILPDLISSAVGSTTKWFSLKPNPEKKTTVTGEINLTFILPKPSIMQFATDHFPALIKPPEDAVPEYKLSDKVELSKLPPSERHRLEILFEFYQTERRYVNDLKLLSSSFQKPLVEQQIISKAEAERIFINFDEIRHINEPFCLALEERERSNSFIVNLSDLVLKYAAEMDPYVTYCCKQASAGELVEQLRKERPQFKEFLDQDLPAWRGLKLEDYLVKPFQRITRYPLLVREMIKVTPSHQVHYEELNQALEIFQNLMTRTNEIIRVEAEKKMNTKVWAMIDASAQSSAFLKSNLQVISSMVESPDTMLSSYKPPKVIDHFPVSYRRDGSVPHNGQVVLFENCIFLLHGKGVQISPLDLIPLLSLQIVDENDKNLITEKPPPETEEEQRVKTATQVNNANQDDKEISYLVAKFVRFERLFYDEIGNAKQAMEPLLDSDIDIMRENIYPLVAALLFLQENFLKGLDQVQELLLSPPTPNEINWLEIYCIFMELMPRFEDVGTKIIDCLPLCYNQKAFSKAFCEEDFILLMQKLFSIVDHTPAYVRSAARILQRIPEDPNLPSLLGTYRMIETSVKSMGTLRRTFDANLEVLAISSRISSENYFKPSRILVHCGELQDVTSGEKVFGYLFNDLFITCTLNEMAMFTLKHAIPLNSKSIRASSSKKTLTAIQMGPTSFQILLKESGKSLLIVNTGTESECSAWMSHVQSVIEGGALESVQQRSHNSKKAQLKVRGSSNVTWTLCFSSEKNAKAIMTKLLPIYHAYLSSVYLMWAQDQYHALPEEDKQEIPKCTVEGFPPGTEQQMLLKDLQSVAIGEYLHTKMAPETLRFLQTTEGRYIELRSTLQQTSLLKHDVSMSSGDLRRKSSAGTSTFNTIRKLLK